MKTKMKTKTTKTFVTQVLKYGLKADNHALIDVKNIVIKYNGGENWNSSYVDDWHDLYIPIKLNKHKVLTKNDMVNNYVAGEYPCSLKQFDNLVSHLQEVLKFHFKIHTTQLSIGNNMLYLEFCVSPI